MPTIKTIAVDFDGTLAYYDGYKGIGVYGPPVESMLRAVRQWIQDGHEVIIHTARVSHEAPLDEIALEEMHIINWLKEHDCYVPGMIITAQKLRRITEFWDDRAIRVERNCGI